MTPRRTDGGRETEHVEYKKGSTNSKNSFTIKLFLKLKAIHKWYTREIITFLKEGNRKKDP